MPFVYSALREAVSEVCENTESDAANIKKVYDDLISIGDEIQLYEVSQRIGLDSELRPSYVIMQGIIETAITKAMKEGVYKLVNAYIVTPRMPTPLMLKEDKFLKDMDLSDPMSFAYYRHNTLMNFLNAGGNISAFYAHDAQTAMFSKDPEGLANYKECVKKWKVSIMDLPQDNLSMDSFPQKYVGAMYDLGDSWITLQSSQVSDVDKGPKLWAIKFGEHALERSQEVLRDF